MTSLRKTLVRAAGMAGPGRVFLAAKAVEIELAYLSFGDAFAVYSWGPMPEQKRETTAVPRSLRRYFGRTVDALPGRTGRRRKRAPKQNRREPPRDDCEC